MKKILCYLVALLVLTSMGLTSCSKDDPQILAKSLSISQKTLGLRTGQEAQLSALTDPYGSGSVTWSSSNDAVVTVDATGLVKATGKGEATITVTTGDGTNMSSTCSVVVYPYLVKMITLDKKQVELEMATSITLSAAVYPDNADDKTLVWASSDENVATVKDGEVSAKRVGKAVITASSTDGSKAVASCVVNVFSSGKTVEVAVDDPANLNEALKTAMAQTTGTVQVNVGKAGETIKTGGIILDKEVTTSNQHIVLNFLAPPVAADDKAIVIKDNQTAATDVSQSTIDIKVPAVKAGQTAPSFIINLPSSTVTLKANADAATYNKVEATTANKTLYIDANVTVKELVIVKGDVYVSGIVEKASAKAKTTIYILKDAKVQKVDNTNNYITIVDLGGTDTTSGTGEDSNVNNSYQWKE